VVADNAELEVAEEAVEATMLKQLTNLLKLTLFIKEKHLLQNKREKLSYQLSPLPRTTTTLTEKTPLPPSLPTPLLNLLSKKWKANQMLLCE
jgi:hypothetical protein